MKYVHIINLMLIALAPCLGAETREGRPTISKLWQQYETAQQTGQEPDLADFSYVGYHCGEQPIPTVDWPVFDVTAFGAVPNDGQSDKTALIKTIAAAEANGAGIVFFPPGRFLLNEESDPHNQPIYIQGDRIVLRGSGCGAEGTELYMDRHMDPTDPDKMWTCPYMIYFKGEGTTARKTSVVADARRETHLVEAADVSGFQPGDWVVLHLKDNSPDTVATAVAPYTPEPSWETIIDSGVMIDEFHKIETIRGRQIVFKEPIHADVKASQGWQVLTCRPLQEIGVEDLAFVGNWHEKFVHHKNAIHDGGWSCISLSRCVNSWVRDCRFTDWNRPLSVGSSSAVTVQDILLNGNKGHNAITLNNSSHSMVRRVNDVSGHHHACGVAGACSGNVLLRCEYSPDTCYESHASQPRWTLFDNISGGWMYGRWGGAEQNQPNHLHGLVFWNYNNTGTGEPDPFHFMRPNSKYGRIIMPYVIGFHGNPQEWVESEIQVLESNGQAVWPESLYEAQFELRQPR
jgi:hypothetical protein